MKNIISQFLYQVGLSQRTIAQAAEKFYYVVNYHRVCPKSEQGIQFPDFFDLRTPPDLFAQHLAFYQKHFEVVSLSQLSGGLGTKPKLLITFDDGYRDNHDHAFRVLQQFEMPALFFVATEVFEQERLLWDNQFFYSLERAGLAAAQNFFSKHFPNEDLGGSNVNQVCRKLFQLFANRVSSHEQRIQLILDFASLTNSLAPHTFIENFYLTREQVTAMASAGMEFGAHTHRHALLPGSTDLEMDFELKHSKEILESVTAKNISTFCYPSGQFNPKVKTAVGDQFAFAFTTQEHKNTWSQDPLLLGRFNVSTQQPHYLAFELSEWKNKLKTFLA